jgi:hypothetical protein
MALISFGTDALAGTIRVRALHNSMLSPLALIFTAMLRDKSVFVDGGVQLYRQNETTWVGFSTQCIFKDQNHLTIYV